MAEGNSGGIMDGGPGMPGLLNIKKMALYSGLIEELVTS